MTPEVIEMINTIQELGVSVSIQYSQHLDQWIASADGLSTVGDGFETFKAGYGSTAERAVEDYFKVLTELKPGKNAVRAYGDHYRWDPKARRWRCVVDIRVPVRVRV